MKLGIGVAITRLSPSISNAISFYQKLGYIQSKKPSNLEDHTFFSDGRMNYLLLHHERAHTKLRYFTPELAKILPDLSSSGINYTTLDKEANFPTQIQLKDPDGFLIDIFQYPAASSFTIDPRGESLLNIGNFGEFALPTSNYPQKKRFWERLGFTPLVEEEMPYPWGIFTDGLIVLGLHQTSEFNVPSMTYFKVNMQETIQEMQQKGIEVVETEMAKIADGNGVVKAPDGQLFFFFEGDVK